MSRSEVLLKWIERILSFEIEDERHYKRESRVAIGNIPPYACVLDKHSFNPITRTLICRIPEKYYDFVCPSEEEKEAALTYRVYYSLQR